MPQPGSTPILIYNSSTASQVPSAANLSQGELAINVTDKKLYTKDSGGNVILIASNGGDVTGPATATDNAIARFDTTTGKLIQNSVVTIADTTGNMAGVGTLSAGAITSSALTSGRVTFASTGGLLADSASLTYDGTTLTSTKFAGAFNGTLGATTPSTVAATDLTTTGNTILGNASTDTLNVGNGDLVKDASGNLGVGTTSPAVKLHAYSSGGEPARFESSLSYSLATVKSTSGSTFLGVSGDGGLLGTLSATPLIFKPNDTERMRLDSSGNLGLGVTPSAWGGGSWLQLKNGIGNASVGSFTLYANSYLNTSFAEIYGQTGAASKYDQTSGIHRWYTAPSGTAGNAISFTQAMTLDSSSNLSVTGGVSISGSVVAGGYTGGELTFPDTTADVYSGISTQATGSPTLFFDHRATSNTGNFRWRNGSGGGTSLMTLTSLGRLGLGTTDPNTKLELRADTTTAGNESNILMFNYTSGTTPYYIGGIFGAGYRDVRFPAYCAGIDFYRGSAAGGLASTGEIRFYTDGNGGTLAELRTAEKMRLTATGDLLVGQTTKSQTTVGFSVTPDGIVSTAMAASTGVANSYHLYSTGAGAYRFYVGLGGTINATSIVISAISDERLKENIKDIDTGLDSIMFLKPRRFDWKEGKGQDKKNVAGFIAQEFETVFPECVSTSMAGADGIEYKNINHETLIPTLVKAIQEQQAMIEELKAKVAALEAA